jgi:hypothetical protein
MYRKINKYRNEFITEKGFVKDAELIEYMRTQIKPAVVEYFQEKMYKNKQELFEKNARNIDLVVNELIEKYDREIGLYEMYLDNTVFTAHSMRFDISEIISDELGELKWIEE